VRKAIVAGERFGRLTVIREATVSASGLHRVECMCACGTTKVVQVGNLWSGHTSSCGCFNREVVTVRNTALANQRRSCLREPPPIRGARWIPLTKGFFALVDEGDYARVSEFIWHATDQGDGRFYAARSIGNSGKQFLHSFILATPYEIEVDHVNRDPLDNRRLNLRPATSSDNKCNRGLQSNNTSGFKGVSFSKSAGRWEAYVKKDYKKVHLGLFSSAENAAIAYNIAALKLYGEFAKLNLCPGEALR